MKKGVLYHLTTLNYHFGTVKATVFQEQGKHFQQYSRLYYIGFFLPKLNNSHRSRTIVDRKANKT